MDGAWLDGLKLGGVGIIARNDNGEFLAARVTRFDDVFSLQQVEALAAREGLAMLVERGFQNVIFETDSLQITADLLERPVNRSLIGPSKMQRRFCQESQELCLPMFVVRATKWLIVLLSLPYVEWVSVHGWRKPLTSWLTYLWWNVMRKC